MKKPRFIRVVKKDGMWLRDRKERKLVGPFASWAAALAYMKRADRTANHSAS
jgi:hypothetical protein